MGKFVIFVVFSLSLLNYGCDRLSNRFCGPLSNQKQTMIESGKDVCKDKCRIEYVPCEFNYVKLYWVSTDLDSTLIGSVHQKLYDDKTREGWPTIMIYDDQGSYLITHGHRGNFYNQSGD